MIDQSAVMTRKIGAVLVLQVPAERPDVDGLPGQALGSPAELIGDLDDLLARFLGREDGRDGRAGSEQDPRDEPGEDDEREPRVTERLRVDATEAVEAAEGSTLG